MLGYSIFRWSPSHRGLRRLGTVGRVIFKYMEIVLDKQVKYVAGGLKGEASAWWLQLCQTQRREGWHPVRTWKRIKQLLRNHLLPTDYK